jgi:cytochrome c peroxidase
MKRHGFPLAALTLAVSVALAQSELTPLDDELRQHIETRGLTGDPTTERELPHIQDPLAQLGKLLFFSKALSGDVDVACASCHHPLLAGGDGLSLSVGVGAENPDLLGPGRKHDTTGRGAIDPDADGDPNVPRNAPSTFNVAMYDEFLFHDGRVESLAKLPGRNGAGGGIIDPDSLMRTADPDAGDNLVEAQARFPTISEDEMLGFRFGERRPGAEVYAHLQARLGNYDIGEGQLPKSDWLALFRHAFNAPKASAQELITFATIIKAMGEYQRSQVFINTPWKRYAQGDNATLDKAQKRGALLFYRAPGEGGAGCVVCHQGDFFTDEDFHVLAMPQIGRGKSNGPWRDHDNGRFKISRRGDEKYAFRTPTLLNVALTGPYGHSGAYGTLDGVVRHHLDPVAAVKNFDYSLQSLAQFTGSDLRYAHAKENTEAALEKLLEIKARGGSLLRSIELSETDITDLVAFLEALTDPCIQMASCLAPWLPAKDDPDPDDLRLDAVFAEEPIAQPPVFTDVTLAAGLDYTHANDLPENPENAEQYYDMQFKVMSGGVAEGDYDGDGWTDLYVVRAAAGSNLLFRNLGDGTFAEVGQAAGVDYSGNYNAPVFADYDGDGDLDLFVGGVSGTRPILARNDGKGRFEDVTEDAGLIIDRNTFSSSFGDYDRDGDLDLFTAHWDLQVMAPASQHLWRNNGNGTFTDITLEAGLGSLVDRPGMPQQRSDIVVFRADFADINGDDWPDLLVAGDFNTSRVYINTKDGSFEDRTDKTALSDENAMGTAVADYDRDGDLDWFVTSISHGDDVPYNPTRYRFGYTGNRLYRNDGIGNFTDVSESAGVRNGQWGWGACFADFNNDGHLDIFHVNGMGDVSSDWWREEFHWFLEDRSRLFMSNGDGTFTEKAEEFGVNDPGQGREIVCFDYDRDGDIDIFVANNGQAPKLYRNNSEQLTSE